MLDADRTIVVVLGTTRTGAASATVGTRASDVTTWRAWCSIRRGLVGASSPRKRVLTYDAAAERPPAIVRRSDSSARGIAVPVRSRGEAAGVLLPGRQDLSGATFTTPERAHEPPGHSGSSSDPCSSTKRLPCERRGDRPPRPCWELSVSWTRTFPARERARSGPCRLTRVPGWARAWGPRARGSGRRVGRARGDRECGPASG